VTSRNFCMISTALGLHCLKAPRADSAFLTTLCSVLICAFTNWILIFSSLLFRDSRDSVSQLRLFNISVCRPTWTNLSQNSVLLSLTSHNSCNQHTPAIQLTMFNSPQVVATSDTQQKINWLSYSIKKNELITHNEHSVCAKRSTALTQEFTR